MNNFSDSLELKYKQYGIFNLIKDVLEKELNLDLQLLVGQSFDGAATMAGIKSGVAKRFIEKVPYAVFVHCYAHKLNGMHLKGNYILIKGELCINKKRRELCKIKCSTIIL